MDFFLSYFIYFFYWILLNIVKSIEYIYLLIFQASEDNDANKIRVSKIMLRYKLTPLDMQMCRPQDFITLFDCYEKVDQLNDPHWTIYTIDKEYAYFVLLPDNMLKYDIVSHPFLWLTYYQKALKVARMSIKNFIEWSKILEQNETPAPTVMFFNSPRTGSTLFGAMLSHPEHSIVFGEPPIFSALSTGYSFGRWNEDDIRVLLPAIIQAQRKNVSSNVLCIFKAFGRDSLLIPYFKESVPDVKLIFLSRKKPLDSAEKLCATLFGGRYASFLPQIYMKLYEVCPNFMNSFAPEYFVYEWILKHLKPRTIKEWSFCYFFGPFVMYQRFKTHFCFRVVWYQELIYDTEQVLRQVFKAISNEKVGIPEECIPNAIGRLRVDSQKGTILSRDVLSKTKLSPYTDDVMARLKMFANTLKISEEVTGFNEFYENHRSSKGAFGVVHTSRDHVEGGG